MKVLTAIIKIFLWPFFVFCWLVGFLMSIAWLIITLITSFFLKGFCNIVSVPSSKRVDIVYSMFKLISNYFLDMRPEIVCLTFLRKVIYYEKS